MKGILQDLRYATRTLGRTPGFTLVALLTLALGIGANSSIFSVINAALLKPLPYPNPDRLMLLYERDVAAEGSGPNIVALANFLDWQKESRAFAAMAAERQNPFNLGGNDRGILPERVDGTICSWSLFAALGVQPMLGRAFTAAEDRHGAPPVAILSYGLWQRRFGGARDILGGQIRLDSKNYNIVGVMPPGFGNPERKVEVWVPVQQVLGTEDIASRGSHQFYVVGRIRDGALPNRRQRNWIPSRMRSTCNTRKIWWAAARRYGRWRRKETAVAVLHSWFCLRQWAVCC